MRLGNTMNPEPYTIELGDESDATLVARLHEAVIASGGSIALSTHDLGGTEELICYAIALPGGELEAIAETSMGLRLSGPQELVSALALLLRQN